MYYFSIKEQVRRLLPPFYRHTGRIQFIYGLLVPMRRIMAKFKAFEIDTEFTLQFSRQTASLEQYLCQRFGVADGVIYITHNQVADPIFVGWESEATPPYYIGYETELALPPVYGGWEWEFDDEVYDFTVHFPAAMLPAKLEQIKARTKELRLVGRRFNIESY